MILFMHLKCILWGKVLTGCPETTKLNLLNVPKHCIWSCSLWFRLYLPFILPAQGWWCCRLRKHFQMFANMHTFAMYFGIETNSTENQNQSPKCIISGIIIAGRVVLYITAVLVKSPNKKFTNGCGKAGRWQGVLYYSLWLFLSVFLVCYTDWRFSSQF